MSILRKAMTQISDEAQYAASVFLARTGLMPHLRVFRLAMNTLEYVGADPRELDYAFSKSHDFGPSFVLTWRNLASRLELKAKQMAALGDFERAKKYFYRATIYFLVSDWAAFSFQEEVLNYDLAMAAFDRYRELCDPPIEKIALQSRVGTLKAHFRVPRGLTAPCPAVVIFPGNDLPKEWATCFENVALNKNLATLSIDGPGCGESRIFGTHLTSRDDMRACAEAALEFLKARDQVDTKSLGLFGVSAGGVLAYLAAAEVPVFKALATIGSPFDLVGAYRQVTGLQKKRLRLWSGSHTSEEAERVMRELDLPGAAAGVSCKTLIVHGMKDDFVSMKDLRSLVAAMDHDAEVKIIEDGDHLCSAQLKQVAPYVFNWIRDRLF